MSDSGNASLEEEHEMHEKFEMQSLKTNIKAYSNGKINLSSDPSGEGYAKAHRVSGGERIELFAIRKGNDGRTRFWMNMSPDQARQYAEQILEEVERAEVENDG